MKITVLIPFADGHALSNEVLKGLAMQTVSINLMPLSRPEVHDPLVIPGNPNSCPNKNLLKELALKLYPDADKFMIMNRTVVFKALNTVERMIHFLDTNEEFGAVAWNRYNEWHSENETLDHINISCIVVRRYVLERIKFYNTNNRCDCSNFTADIRLLAKYNKFKYLCYIE